MKVIFCIICRLAKSAQVILQSEICSQRLMAEEGGLPHLHQGEQVIQQDDHALHDEYVLDDEDQRDEH